MKVIYEGNNSTPLTLDFLIVQNGTVSSTTTTASSHGASGTHTSDGASATSSTGKSSTPTGAIVGGVIGGIALAIFALLGFLLLRRRQRHAAQEKYSVSTPTPFGYTPLHPSSATTSGGISYSQSPQTAQMGGNTVGYGAKGQVYHASMPSLTSTDVSRSIEPPSTASGVASYPTNLQPVPLQQTALALANPSSSSPPASVSSIPSPRKTEREAEALASLRPQRRDNPSVPVSVQNNDTWSPNIVLHADSGLRMPPATASTSVVDVPPIYTPD